jgi:hypothetical protein
MTTTSVKEIECTQQKCGAQSRVCPLGTRFLYCQTSLLLGRRHMRVKLCSRCPYSPLDLAGYYDPAGFFTSARSVTANKR